MLPRSEDNSEDVGVERGSVCVVTTSETCNSADWVPCSLRALTGILSEVDKRDLNTLARISS